ncbi:DUF6112 family protein [Propionibacterium freudenreichii]|uniref:DUF6112 family protein n=1 Tax=Propionibacterium freudenreichii TaxID=1744 RepID=UPI0040586F9D
MFSVSATAWWPSCWEFIVIDLVSALVQLPAVLPMDIDISPNDSGLPGISQLRTIVGAVMTIGLILSVLALIISAIVWGFGSNSSNPHLAGRGKIGVLVSCGAAVICGAAVTLINFFWNVGQQV